jgi:hypothetical protein
MEAGKIIETGKPLELLFQNPSTDTEINRDTYFA